MSEDFGPTFITVTDEDGKELVLEFVDALEYNGQMYQAFFPAETEGENDDDPDNEDGEDLLSTLDSDEELEAVYEQFMELLFDEDEEYFLCFHADFYGLRHSACPAGCVIDLFLTHISLLGMHLSGCGSQASRLPFAAGSWKRRSILEATHLY